MEIRALLAESRLSSICLWNDKWRNRGPGRNGSVGAVAPASITLRRLRDLYFNGAVRLSLTISGNDQFGRVEQSAPGKQAAPKEKSKFGF